MTNLKYRFKRVFSLSLNHNHVVFTSVFLLYCVHVVYIQCSLHFLQVLLLEPDKQYQPSYTIHSADYFTDAVSVVVTIVDMLPVMYVYDTAFCYGSCSLWLSCILCGSAELWCIFHVVPISCITVLYETLSTVMWIIGQ